jgi:hypothetical protein
MDARLLHLPHPVAEDLAGPPDEEWALLELALEWPSLVDGQARVAARLRVFLLTRDLLDRTDRLAPAWATATGNGDDYEVVVYLPLTNALTLADVDDTPVAEVLARLAESAIVVGAAHESLLVAGAYPQAQARGDAPPLLSDPVADLPVARVSRRLADPVIRRVSAGWQPIGLGAIQDLVQARFGPVELDRTTVRLTAAGRPTAGCPACRGEGFGFPADLHERLPAMCAPHAEEARRTSQRRLARAARSNPRGWAAIGEGTQRLEETPPPLRLGRRLRATLEDEADPSGSGDDPEAFRARIAADARLILDLAEHYGDDAAPFDDLLEGDENLGWRLLDWQTNTMLQLGRAGHPELIVPVGQALQRLDREAAAVHAADMAVALAEQGWPEAVGHAEANLRAHPEDIWVRIKLGDVHRELGDAARAEDVYRQAIAQVREHGEPFDVLGAYERLNDLLATQPDRAAEAKALEQEAATVAGRRRTATRRSRSPRVGQSGSTSPAVPLPPHISHPPVRRDGPKVGRNEPCPCGSGKKYKRCHGA